MLPLYAVQNQTCLIVFSQILAVVELFEAYSFPDIRVCEDSYFIRCPQ
jgi:hypothetical protein